MIDLLQNPFSTRSSFQSKRQIVDTSASPKVVPSPLSSPSVSASWKIKDEYVPSVSPSSDTYKRSSVPVPVNMSDEIVQKGEITDKMREEMKIGGASWQAMGLLSVAYPTLYGIIKQVFDEKGIGEVFSTEGGTYGMGINPDGVFIFPPDEFNVSGVDLDFAEEICLALETALNSSSLNMRENPHLFTRELLPPEYDPAKWGRTIDPETWALHHHSDFSGFINELRLDIFKTFSDSQIMDFSMKIDDQGKLTIIDVKTEGNDPKANARAAERMNRGLTDEIEKKAEYLVLLMLSVRQYTDGDVLVKDTILEPFDDGMIGNIKQFRHEVVITSDSGYRVIFAEGKPNSKSK